jgi:hypothetical protein
VFGRQPKLPIDLAFGLNTEKERKPHTKYIQEIRERLVQAYKLASEASIKAQTKQKEGYDLTLENMVIGLLSCGEYNCMHELKVLRVLSNFSSFLVPKFLTFLITSY